MTHVDPFAPADSEQHPARWRPNRLDPHAATVELRERKSAAEEDGPRSEDDDALPKDDNAMSEERDHTGGLVEVEELTDAEHDELQAKLRALEAEGL